MALIVTVVLAGVVVIALPIAIRSMTLVLFGDQRDTLYDLIHGGVVPPVVAPTAPDQSYVNIVVVHVDPVEGLATLAVSGNRVCSAVCPTVVLTLLALDDNAAQRRGLPPSAALTLGSSDRIFSQSVELPGRGQPSLYPFNTYEI